MKIRKTTPAPKAKVLKVTYVDIGPKKDPSEPFSVYAAELTVTSAVARQFDDDLRRHRVGLRGHGEFGPYGNRLRYIRDAKMWKLLKPKTGNAYSGFNDFCMRSEDISGSKASRLINSAQMIVVLKGAGLVPMATLDQMEPLLSLTEGQAIAVVEATAKTANSTQPSSTALKEKAVALGFRKGKKTKKVIKPDPVTSIQAIIKELERAVSKPEHAELVEVVIRLKAAVLSAKVADSATSEDSEDSGDPAALMAVNTPEIRQAAEEQAGAPIARTGGAAAAFDPSRLPIPDVDPGASLRSASNRSASLVVPCQPSVAMASGNGYTIKVVEGLVEIHFESREDSSRLRAIVPKWPLLFRYDGNTENWYSRDDSKETACGLMERTEAIFKESSQW
jgi:hypothetical protein